MAQYRKKPIEVVAFSFEELKEFVEKNSRYAGDKGPKSARYNEYLVVLESDETIYVVGRSQHMGMTPEYMLVLGESGHVHTTHLENFREMYDPLG